MLVAFACFVHCIAGPILLSFAGLRSLIGVSEKLNPLFLVASSAVAVITLVPAYRRRHRRIICLVLFGAGVLSLALGRQTPRGFEMAATICGATLIVSAHILNMRLASRCSCCRNGSLKPVEKLEKAV
jgi:hypothetical protein